MLCREKRGGHCYPAEVFVPGEGGAGACLAEFRKGIKPQVPGKNHPESGYAHGRQAVFACTGQVYFHSLQVNEIYLEGDLRPGEGENGSVRSGRDCDCRIFAEREYQHGGICHVPAGHWGNIGRVDP